jgi:hypothetical protein
MTGRVKVSSRARPPTKGSFVDHPTNARSPVSRYRPVLQAVRSRRASTQFPCSELIGRDDSARPTCDGP